MQLRVYGFGLEVSGCRFWFRNSRVLGFQTLGSCLQIGSDSSGGGAKVGFRV